MRLARAIAALWRAKLGRWNRTWSTEATIVDNAALVTLVALAVYKLLGMAR